MRKYYYYKVYTIRDLFKIKTYPYVDQFDNLYLNESEFIYKSKTPWKSLAGKDRKTPCTKEEINLYKRYMKAKKLMER